MNLNKWCADNDNQDLCIYCGSINLKPTKKKKEVYAEQIYCYDCNKKMYRWTMKDEININMNYYGEVLQ